MQSKYLHTSCRDLRCRLLCVEDGEEEEVETGLSSSVESDVGRQTKSQLSTTSCVSVLVLARIKV